jgi:hypothetical protein
VIKLVECFGVLTLLHVKQKIQASLKSRRLSTSIDFITHPRKEETLRETSLRERRNFEEDFLKEKKKRSPLKCSHYVNETPTTQHNFISINEYDSMNIQFE